MDMFNRYGGTRQDDKRLKIAGVDMRWYLRLNDMDIAAVQNSIECLLRGSLGRVALVAST